MSPNVQTSPHQLFRPTGSRRSSSILAVAVAVLLAVGGYATYRIMQSRKPSGPPNGPTLRTVLPDQAGFPGGWKLVRTSTTSSGAVNSPGTSPTRPLVKCEYLASMGALSALAQAEGQVSYAGNDAQDNAGHFLIVAVGAYKPQTVTQPFTALQTWLRQCPNWTDEALNIQYARRAVTIPGLGDQNDELQMYPTDSGFVSKSFAFSSDLLIVRVKHTVLFISASVNGSEHMPSLPSIARPMIAKLEQLQ